MSHRWTNFVKGPNLQDTITSFSTSKPNLAQTNTEKQHGIHVSQVYEEIISEPSASTSVASSNPSHNFKKPSKSELTSQTSKEPAPEFSTLLRLAEKNNFSKLATILSQHENLDLDRQDEFGWTPLMVSACAGASDCVQLFLQHGANWRIRDKKGLTALTLARKKHLNSICELIENWDREFKGLQKQRISEEHQNQKTLELNSQKPKEKEFCSPCQVETEDPALHSNSIAHLLTTSADVPEKIHYGIPESNRGFQLLLKTGWDRDSGGLGPEGKKGQKFPVKTILKQDRVGLGGDEEGTRKRARITHFAAFDVSAVERQVKPEERLERKKTVAKKAQANRKTREIRKEIDYRRELGSL